jgi:hypothetical protein
MRSAKVIEFGGTRERVARYCDIVVAEDDNRLVE